jgi:hypothetical protein
MRKPTAPLADAQAASDNGSTDCSAVPGC